MGEVDAQGGTDVPREAEDLVQEQLRADQEADDRLGRALAPGEEDGRGGHRDATGGHRPRRGPRAARRPVAEHGERHADDREGGRPREAQGEVGTHDAPHGATPGDRLSPRPIDISTVSL